MSFVLSGRRDVHIGQATRERVVAAARELNYHPHGPARQLAGGSSQTLGMVLRQSAQQVAADALLAETLHGLAGAARADGYRVLIEPLPPVEGGYADLLRSQRVDGIVVSGPRADDEELAALSANGFPIVLQGSRADLGIPSVDIDNRSAARDAVSHLIERGHRRVACVTNAPLAYTAAADRVAGYRDALKAAGIDDDPSLIAEGSFDAASGAAAIKELLTRVTFSAVFVASDVVALGVVRALKRAGFAVPGDVAVVGFDDVALAEHFDPPLTTIRVPARGLGQTAGRVLLDRIRGRDVPPRTLLPTELIVRESSGLELIERVSAPGGAR